jgi:hypothetical protein
MSVIRQLSVFGVEMQSPGPGDLAGLLAGGGQVVRMGGTARVAIGVDDPWRAAVLIAECERRGLAATCVSTAPGAAAATGPAELTAVRVEEDEIPEGYAVQPPPPSRSRTARRPSRQRAIGPDPPTEADPEDEPDPVPDALTPRRVRELEVRTAFSAKLLPLAAVWLPDGTSKIPPADLVLRGHPLRLWVQACGRMEAPDVYALEVGEGEDAGWPVVRAALTAAGVRSDLIRGAADGPILRIKGRRRVARLAELIGDPPRPAPDGFWPTP